MKFVIITNRYKNKNTYRKILEIMKKKKNML